MKESMWMLLISEEELLFIISLLSLVKQTLLKWLIQSKTLQLILQTEKLNLMKLISGERRLYTTQHKLQLQLAQ